MLILQNTAFDQKIMEDLQGVRDRLDCIDWQLTDSDSSVPQELKVEMRPKGKSFIPTTQVEGESEGQNGHDSIVDSYD